VAIAIPATRITVLNPAGIDYYPEGAGLTNAKTGDLVKLVANVLVPAAAADTGLMVLAGNGTGTVGTSLPVYKIDTTTRFFMNLNTGLALAAAHRGSAQDLILHANGTAMIATTVAATRVEIVEIGLLPAAVHGAIADTGARVVAKPIGIGTNWK
jgi:hypothetical protein